MLRLFLKNFLMIGILTAAACGLLWPSPGAVLADANLLPVLIVVIFVCSGLLLQPGSLKRQLRNGRAIGFALLAINIIFPLVALLIARIFNITGDAFIGLLVVAAAPPTLASGIIITTLAGGATALAILLTILGNLSAVVIMPFSLRIVLSLTTEIDLPVLRMLAKLLLLVVLPTVVGYLLGGGLPRLVEKRRPIVALIPNLAIVLIVFMLVSRGSGNIRNQGSDLVLVAMAALAVHVVMLVVNRLAGLALRLDTPAAKALTFVASQKTLPVTAAVIAQAFPAHPAAIVPCVLFHLLQIILDTLLANRWAKKKP